HLDDRGLLVEAALRHSAAPPAPGATGVALHPRRPDAALDLAPPRVAPLGLVEDAVVLLADHERAVERLQHAVPPRDGRRRGYQFGYQTGWDAPDLIRKTRSRFGLPEPNRGAQRHLFTPEVAGSSPVAPVWFGVLRQRRFAADRLSARRGDRIAGRPSGIAHPLVLRDDAS